MITVNSLGNKLKNSIYFREILISAIIIALLLFLFIRSGLPIILTIFIEFAVFAIITMSLNLEVGYTGISQFGRVAAVIVGAFAVGSIPGRLMAMLMGLPYGVEYASDTVNFTVVPQINELLVNSWLLSLGFLLMCVILAGVFGAAIGWLISRPAIRLKEAYLGISLLAFGDFFMWVGHNWKGLVGGSVPVYVPDPFRIFAVDRFTVIVLFIFVVAFLVYLYLNKLTKSPFGRNLRMVRDNDVSAAAAGINVVRVRTQSLVIGSALAAIAGGLYVIYTGTVAAIGFTRLTFTFWPWAFMMLGGIGSNIGMLLGVFLLTILRTMIVIFRSQWFGFLLNVGIDPLWLEFTLMGAVIIIVILFLPHGLVPERVEPMLSANRVRKIMARRQ
ncbi:MAG: branched-chain amino acid ABC transporter permease [Bacillota bacterium]|nr:branched-chain amino acid ABC transporter permease [Bacillota bacterium]